MSQKNSEGITIKPTKKSATASETIKALVLVRRFRLLHTRKIVNPFPVMVRNERTQPRIQNQVSILNSYRKFLSTVEYNQHLAYISGTHVNWLYNYYGTFSHDVTAAILVFQNNETAATLACQPILWELTELFSYVNALFCSNQFA